LPIRSAQQRRAAATIAAAIRVLNWENQTTHTEVGADYPKECTHHRVRLPRFCLADACGWTKAVTDPGSPGCAGRCSGSLRLQKKHAPLYWVWRLKVFGHRRESDVFFV
jgi:hypothetical protein